MKISDCKLGDVLIVHEGLACREPGITQLEQDDHGLYFWCRGPFSRPDDVTGNRELDYKHYLVGLEEEPGGPLVGVSLT